MIEDPALDAALEIAGITLEIVLLALLSHRRVYRLLPFFYSYIGWCVVSDCVMVFLQYRYASHYLQIFIVQVGLDSALQYCLMVELAWSVLRPIRVSLPRGAVAGISLLLIAVGAANLAALQLPKAFSRFHRNGIFVAYAFSSPRRFFAHPALSDPRGRQPHARNRVARSRTAGGHRAREPGIHW